MSDSEIREITNRMIDLKEAKVLPYMVNSMEDIVQLTNNGFHIVKIDESYKRMIERNRPFGIYIENIFNSDLSILKEVLKI